MLLIFQRMIDRVTVQFCKVGRFAHDFHLSLGLTLIDLGTKNVQHDHFEYPTRLLLNISYPMNLVRPVDYVIEQASTSHRSKSM